MARGDGAARVRERAETWAALKEAVSRHAYNSGHPNPGAHYDACIADLRKESPDDWPWYLKYFRGEVKACTPHE